jgi:hypothetical protein
VPTVLACPSCRTGALARRGDPLCLTCMKASREMSSWPLWIFDSLLLREALARVNLAAVPAIVRAACGLSQRDLASIAGWSPAALSYYERGQSVARPRLQIPGLHGWIEALIAQDQPELDVRLSQAGRRAMILARMWGSRAAAARDLLDLDKFLREFQASGSDDDEAYPSGDGVRLAPGEGCLMLGAAVRTLPALGKALVRERVNHLLYIGILHRGLVVPCSECERRAFYRIELLGETSTCQRCGATPIPVPPGGPVWMSRNGSMTSTEQSGSSSTRTATCRS